VTIEEWLRQKIETYRILRDEAAKKNRPDSIVFNYDAKYTILREVLDELLGGKFDNVIVEEEWTGTRKHIARWMAMFYDPDKASAYYGLYCFACKKILGESFTLPSVEPFLYAGECKASVYHREKAIEIVLKSYPPTPSIE
jgi:hypothetical protein